MYILFLLSLWVVMHIILHTDKKNCHKHLIYQAFAAVFGGKEGIRTPEALLTLTRFPGGPLQPLEHLSKTTFSPFTSHLSPCENRVQKYNFFSIWQKKMYICKKVSNINNI